MMKNRQPPLRTASLQPIADALIVLVDCHVTLPAVTIHEDLSVYRMEIEWRERYLDHNMLVFPDVRCVKLPHCLLLRSNRREPVLHSKVISTLKGVREGGGTAARNEPWRRGN